MIYTVTFNPAVDYVVRLGEMKPGAVNRAEHTGIFFGGKGINVSIVLNELGVRSKALGFVAGFTGEAIEQGVRRTGVETDFIHLKDGCSRINVKLRAEEETEINGGGPVIGEDMLNKLFAQLDALDGDDTLVLAGSIPAGMPADVYGRILKRLSGKKIRVVVDAAGDLLMNAVGYGPFLVKPNVRELGELFCAEPEGREEIAAYARKLKALGAKNVLVSMAEEGALLLEEDGALHVCGACRGSVVNSVGAGDSMVAGFLAGMQRGDYEYALRLGCAAGGATAFSEGLARKEEIFRLFKEPV